MKFEFSAGGIVFRRDKNKKIEILVAQHSAHHGWVFPKGLIGDHVKGEKKEETAVREVKEETGIEAKIVEALEPVTYWYQMKGDKIKKTVYYYIMEHTSGSFDESDEEMEKIEWLPIDAVLDRLTYRSDKEVFKKARPIIERLATSV